MDFLIPDKTQVSFQPFSQQAINCGSLFYFAVYFQRSFQNLVLKLVKCVWNQPVVTTYRCSSLSWHKHTVKTSYADTAMLTEFCHWERQQSSPLQKTKPRTPLFWHIPHYYVYPKGPADTPCCHGYSNSVAAAQRKLQPWDFTQLQLRVDVTKWNFSSLALLCDKIRQKWQKRGPGGTLKKIHTTKHFSEWKAAHLYVSLNDTEKEEATHLTVVRANGNKIVCLELLVWA